MPKQRSIEDFLPYNLEMLVTVPDDHKTEGGIFIPEGVDLGAEGKLNRVVKKGESCRFVEIGDEIIITTGRNNITALQFKEGTFALVRENQIGGVVRPSKKLITNGSN